MANRITPRTKQEVKRKNRFMLVFPADVGGTLLQASVHASARPTWKVTDQTLHYMNTPWYLSGKVTWDTWKCDFYDYVVDNTLKELNKWWKLVYDPSTYLMKTPDIYKKDVLIYMLGPGLEEDIVETYKLSGTWPMEMSGGDLDMTAMGDVISISVTFRYDSIEIVE